MPSATDSVIPSGFKFQQIQNLPENYFLGSNKAVLKPLQSTAIKPDISFRLEVPINRCVLAGQNQFLGLQYCTGF